MEITSTTISNSLRSEGVDTSASYYRFRRFHSQWGQQTDNDARATTILSDTLSNIREEKEGFASFLSYSKDHYIPLTIYLHSEAGKVEAGTYNANGQEIIQFAKDTNIPWILDMENGLSTSDFLDYIRLNPGGQKRMAEIVLKNINATQSTVMTP